LALAAQHRDRARTRAMIIAVIFFMMFTCLSGFGEECLLAGKPVAVFIGVP
jgi:hypothetical protein